MATPKEGHLRRSFAAAIVLVVMSPLVAGHSALAKPQGGGKPALVEPKWGDESSPIRPGASLGGYCTFNWIFYDKVSKPKKKPPRIYIGTAGHCTETLGEKVKTGSLEVGKVVYDSDLAKSAVDFSLIEIHPELVSQTNPRMLGWDGPKGVVTPDMLALGDRVDVYGYGVGVGSFEETRPRYGFLMEWNDTNYAANMPAVNGDSGSPLLHHDTGLALGIISQYGIRVPPTTDYGPLVPWILDEVDKAGFHVTLATI